MPHPSEDTYHAERPELNAWMVDQTAKKIRRPQAAKLQSLAKDLHEDPDKLAKTIPEDTLRRLKYPLIEDKQADGKTTFRHPAVTTDGRRPLLATDHTE